MAGGVVRIVVSVRLVSMIAVYGTSRPSPRRASVVLDSVGWIVEERN